MALGVVSQLVFALLPLWPLFLLSLSLPGIAPSATPIKMEVLQVLPQVLFSRKQSSFSPGQANDKSISGFLVCLFV